MNRFTTYILAFACFTLAACGGKKEESSAEIEKRQQAMKEANDLNKEYIKNKRQLNEMKESINNIQKEKMKLMKIVLLLKF